MPRKDGAKPKKGAATAAAASPAPPPPPPPRPSLYKEALAKAKHSVRELQALGDGIDVVLGVDAPFGRRAAADAASARLAARDAAPPPAWTFVPGPFPSSSGAAGRTQARAGARKGLKKKAPPSKRATPPPWRPPPHAKGKRSPRVPPKDGSAGGFAASTLLTDAGGAFASPPPPRPASRPASGAVSVPRSASRAALAAAAAARAPPAHPAALLEFLVAAGAAARDAGAWPSTRPPTLRQVMRSGVLAGQPVEFRPREPGPGSSRPTGRPLTGVVTLDGLVDCRCPACAAAEGGVRYSCSDFEEHAGSKERRPGESIWLTDAASSLKAFCAAVTARPRTRGLHAPVCAACGCGGTLPDGGGSGGDARPLVACAGCGTAAHPRCVGLASPPPPAPWHCAVCVDAGRSAGGPSGAAARFRPALGPGQAPPARVHVSAPAAAPATASAAARRDKMHSNKHKRLFMGGEPGALADGEPLFYRVGDGAVLLRGAARVPPRARANAPAGILCECCGTVVSCSQFESHAGRGARRAPYDNIVNADGLSLRKLASAAPAAPVDDGRPGSGGSSGGGGSRYRSPLPPRPPSAGASKAANDRAAKAAAKAAAPLAAAQAAAAAPSGTAVGCVLCRGRDFDRDGFGERTIMICDQCEREFHVGCLHAHGRARLAALPDGDWFCSAECHTISEALRRVVAARAFPLAGAYSLSVLRGRDGSPATAWALRASADVLGESFDPIRDGATGADLTAAMVHAQCLGDWDCSNVHTALLKHRGVPVAAAVREGGREGGRDKKGGGG